MPERLHRDDEEEVQCCVVQRSACACASVPEPCGRVGTPEHAQDLKMPPKRVFPRQESLLLPAVINPFHLDFKVTKRDKIKVSAASVYFLLLLTLDNICRVTEARGRVSL